MNLWNKYDKSFLKNRLNSESFQRKTISFYRYVKIDDPESFRNQCYFFWDQLNCLGRIYIAHEGINAQMSVPEPGYSVFLNQLSQIPQLKDVPVKVALEDDGKSFYKLTVKVRPYIVADGLDPESCNPADVGQHLSALEFHELHDADDTVVIDMRNHYESEIGRFVKAWYPDADTFSEAIRMVEEKFSAVKSDKKFLLYCTGGIRCEKASAYLKSRGFRDVNQLHGGIIEYAQQMKRLDLPSKFTGKNFVFDQRLGERIDGRIISQCHQCGEPCDTHINCANDACHLLFIQCHSCREKYEGCCSEECASILRLPSEERKAEQKLRLQKYSESKIFKSRLRPDLRFSLAHRNQHHAASE